MHSPALWTKLNQDGGIVNKVTWWVLTFQIFFSIKKNDNDVDDNDDDEYLHKKILPAPGLPLMMLFVNMLDSDKKCCWLLHDYYKSKW